jgi:glycosyltransferase involved in cell wall biosynthesis
MDDIDGMAERALEILNNEALARSIGAAAKATVGKKYCVDRIVPMYEKYYSSVSN